MENNSRNKLVTEKLKQYAKKEKKPLSIGLILSMIRTAMEIIGPLIIGFILNNYIKVGIDSSDFKSIMLLLTIYLIVYLLSGWFSNWALISFEKAANKIAFSAQKDVYDHVTKLPIAYFDNLPSGSIVSRITNDTNKLKMMFQLILADLTTSTIMIVSLYGMILVTNWLVGVMLLILVPIIYLVFKDLRYKSSKYTSLNRSYIGDINAVINENIQNMEIVKAFNREDYIKDEFNCINQKILETNLEISKVRSYGGFRAIDIIGFIATVIVLLYFGVGKITDSYVVNIGSMYIAIDYTAKIFDNLKTVVRRYGELEQSYASATHIFDLMELKQIKQHDLELDCLNGDVRFENVYFAYGKEDVLKDISFEVKSGETLAFVGSTGSGKSTIINLILNFYSPREGKIYIDDKDISDIDRNSLRKHMAVVLQDSFIFETDIKSNIRLNDSKYTDEDIEKALIDVGGEALVKRGIDQKILEKGNNLSQGEKQLISFARAYIRNPKILILDEATSNIDTETEKIIQKGVERLKENRTTFIIAHRLSTIKDVDKIIVLNKGKIIEAGNHDSLMAKDSFYRNMYDEQIRNQ